LALGNAYGSNITNIGLILGLTAVLKPITVHSKVLRQELPVLLAVTLLSVLLLFDGNLSQVDAMIMLLVFGGFMGWSIFQGMRGRADALGSEVSVEMDRQVVTPLRAGLDLVIGLVLLIASSRMLVWGAVDVAQDLGVSDALIGLTVVAIGTSLPELAASIAAVRKGEHDIALGNVIGSNLFNTLAVVGIAGSIHPLDMPEGMMTRDFPMMGGITVFLFIAAFGFRGRTGHINRVEGALLLVGYLAYNAVLIRTVVQGG
jgi:cation:H+ antiporter